MWKLLLRTKKRAERLPLVAKQWKLLPTSFVQYVCLCVNIFNYLACCHSVYGSILTGIVIEFLCQYWSTYGESCPIFHSDLSQTETMPSSPENCLIDKSRLFMPDYEARFILNPTKNCFFRLFLCVSVRQRKTIRDKGCAGSVCIFYCARCFF